MQSPLPKVLHEIAGKTLLEHVIDTAKQLQPTKLQVVVGYMADEVKRSFKNVQGIEFAHQIEVLGTGDAVKSCLPHWRDFKGPLLVLCGDVPAIRCQTLQNLLLNHKQFANIMTLITARLDDPTGYGRVLLDEKGQVKAIVEEKDASPAQKKICEINAGIAVYDSSFLFESVQKLKPSNQQKEYYLTDLVQMATSSGQGVGRLLIDSPTEVLGINDMNQLAMVDAFMRQQKSTKKNNKRKEGVCAG